MELLDASRSVGDEFRLVKPSAMAAGCPGLVHLDRGDRLPSVPVLGEGASRLVLRDVATASGHRCHLALVVFLADHDRFERGSAGWIQWSPLAEDASPRILVNGR